MTTWKQLLAEAKSHRAYAEEMSKVGKQYHHRARTETTLPEIERTYYLAIANARKTLAIAYHAAAHELESAARILKGIEDGK